MATSVTSSVTSLYMPCFRNIYMDAKDKDFIKIEGDPLYDKPVTIRKDGNSEVITIPKQIINIFCTTNSLTPEEINGLKNTLSFYIPPGKSPLRGILLIKLYEEE